MNRNMLSAATATRPANNAGSMPAIRPFYPYLKSFLSLFIPAVLALYHILIYLMSQLAKPIVVLSPIPILLYILSPVFAFCQILFDLLVSNPVKVLAYILDAVYPVYVFIGVACITGCLFGLGARYLSDRLVRMVVKCEDVSSSASSPTDRSMSN